MSTKQAVATIIGGIVLFAVGYLLFNLAFASFYAANTGSASGVERVSPILWAVALGSIAYAALITYVLSSHAGPLSISQGAVVGAIVGFLLWFTADFTLYGFTNMSNLTLTVVDPLLELIHGACGGAAIAAVVRQKPAA